MLELHNVRALPARRGPRHGRLVWICTLGLGALYLIFLLLVAFRPASLGTALPDPDLVLWAGGLLLLSLTFTLATLHFRQASHEFAQATSGSMAMTKPTKNQQQGE
ncbi:hypothetical protein BN1049_02718 [Pseudomonas saudimassiliensis]|uniref:DUF485 domain-containing protein n=1 Tax=Pseudomonas saudimassiliensis TaxID=1461581 RepID=A0A078MJB7_9PSED|nr:DUF485 domain-containing protein [Pseudomonas saudimassiliensis]CEA06334.1 hypothetical protein BN1049_02718 [Pseudomonas saudimassiliensis]CEF27759.1 hypothetical protein BN1049_02718 [Pseudomonas saudimassiliensis]